MAMAGSDTEFITIARVLRTQGRHGEVLAELHTAFPEAFAARNQLYALTPEGVRRSLALESFWPHKGGMALKFAGVESIDQAEELEGCEIQITQQQRMRLENGSTYVSDLVGCRVYAAPDGDAQGTWQEVGVIEAIQFDAGDAPLLVVRSESKEKLIPFAQAFVKKFDGAGKRLEMVLPPGLLELDAPLTAEEKREQQRKD
jgi:16S rRNA processing protein RimM